MPVSTSHTGPIRSGTFGITPPSRHESRMLDAGGTVTLKDRHNVSFKIVNPRIESQLAGTTTYMGHLEDGRPIKVSITRRPGSHSVKPRLPIAEVTISSKVDTRLKEFTERLAATHAVAA